MTDRPLSNDSQIRPPAHADGVLCHCVFTLSDVADVWTELLEDDDAELPPAVLEKFLSSVRLVDDAMCERGYDAIRSVLEIIREGREA